MGSQFISLIMRNYVAFHVANYHLYTSFGFRLFKIRFSFFLWFSYSVFWMNSLGKDNLKCE